MVGDGLSLELEASQSDLEAKGTESKELKKKKKLQGWHLNTIKGYWEGPQICCQ